MADAWATGPKQHSSQALLTSSTRVDRSGTQDITPLVSESTQPPVTLGLQIPTLRRSQALLTPPSTKDPEQLPVRSRASAKRKECVELSPSDPCGTLEDARLLVDATRSRALSDVAEDVDTDALAAHLFAVIRSAEAALHALGFEEDADSVGADLDAVELDATDGGRDSPLA